MAITDAVAVPAPAHCLVEAAVTVNKPGPWAIRFKLALPEAGFQNRHLMFSQGGSGGGSVPWTPADASVASPLQHDFNRLLRAGFAVAATDKGRAPKGPFDFSWVADAAQKINWDQRAIQTVAQVTQDLTRAWYGVPQLYRYTSGCSGGGMASFNNLRGYGGKQFDGIVLGSTVPLSPIAGLAWPRILQHIARHPEGWISTELMRRAQEAILAAYDAVDGQADGIIENPRKIKFDAGLLRQSGFTPAQVETFMKVLEPWTYHGANQPIQVPGFSFSRPTDWSQWFIGQVPPPWTVATRGAPLGFLVSDSSFRAQFGADMNFITDLDLADPVLHKRLQAGTHDGGQAAPFDFQSYRDKGGKLLTYYGVDDAAIAVDWTATIRQGAAAHETSPDALNRWFRSVRVPGSVHCGGGEGPNDTAERLLDAMVEWVEKGVAPQAIVATRRDGKVFSLTVEP